MTGKRRYERPGLLKQIEAYIGMLKSKQATVHALHDHFPERSIKDIHDVLRKSALLERIEHKPNNPIWRLKRMTEPTLDTNLKDDLREHLRKMVPQTVGELYVKFSDRATRAEIQALVNGDPEIVAVPGEGELLEYTLVGKLDREVAETIPPVDASEPEVDADAEEIEDSEKNNYGISEIDTETESERKSYQETTKELLDALRRRRAPPAPSLANAIQVGGDHYKARAIQPWDAIRAWDLGFFDGNAVKYIARWKDKGGVEDLKKARHYLDKLIELEESQK